MTSNRSLQKAYFDNLRGIQSSPDGTNQGDGVSPDVAEDIGYKHPSDLPVARHVGGVAIRPEQRLEPHVPLDPETKRVDREGIAAARQVLAETKPDALPNGRDQINRILDNQRPRVVAPLEVASGSPDQVA